VSFSTRPAYILVHFNGGFYIVVTFIFLGVEIILLDFAILSLFLFKKKR